MVTFNIKEGRRIAEATSALAAHRELRQADIVVLQEMNADAVEAVARALRMNSAYFPRMRASSSSLTSGASGEGRARPPACSFVTARAPSACTPRTWDRPGTPARPAAAIRRG